MAAPSQGYFHNDGRSSLLRICLLRLRLRLHGAVPGRGLRFSCWASRATCSPGSAPLHWRFFEFFDFDRGLLAGRRACRRGQADRGPPDRRLTEYHADGSAGESGRGGRAYGVVSRRPPRKCMAWGARSATGGCLVLQEGLRPRSPWFSHDLARTCCTTGRCASSRRSTGPVTTPRTTRVRGTPSAKPCWGHGPCSRRPGSTSGRWSLLPSAHWYDHGGLSGAVSSAKIMSSQSGPGNRVKPNAVGEQPEGMGIPSCATHPRHAA